MRADLKENLNPKVATLVRGKGLLNAVVIPKTEGNVFIFISETTALNILKYISYVKNLQICSSNIGFSKVRSWN